MKIIQSIILISTLILSSSAFATDRITIEIAIKEHKFIPEKVEAPEGKVIVLLIHNQDETAEEFESTVLKREKLIPSKQTAKIIVGPLKAGEYKFFGEFHDPQPQGVLVISNQNLEQ